MSRLPTPRIGFWNQSTGIYEKNTSVKKKRKKKRFLVCICEVLKKDLLPALTLSVCY